MRKYVFMAFFLLFEAPAWAQWNPDTLVNTYVRRTPGIELSLAKITPDGFGGFITSWTMLDASINKLYVQRIDGSGIRRWDTLGVPITVTDASQVTMAPNTGFGGALLAWKDMRTGAEGIYAQKISTDGIVRWTTNGISVVRGISTTSPQIVEDGADGTWVTWIQPDSIGNNHAWLQHLSSSATGLLPGGLPIPIFPVDSTRILGLHTLSDGMGGIIIGMIYNVTGGLKDTLLVKRYRNDGTQLWSKPAIHSLYSAGQYPFDLKINNDGKVFITAFVDQTGQWVALQKMSLTSGDSLWANMVNTGLPSFPQALRVVPDNNGGAYVIFKDSLYLNVQHIDSTGAKKSGVSGFTFFNTLWVNASATIDTVDVTKDGQGGILIAWTDNRNGSYKHIYGQRLSADSTRLWNVNGVTIASKPGTDQYNVQVLPDGIGGMYAVWYNPNNDVSAARLYNNGTLVGIGTPSSLRATPYREGVKIFWNKYVHPKLRNYRVVRGASSGFNPAVGVNVGAPLDTFIVDYPTPLSTPFYYRVAAVDSLALSGAYSSEIRAMPMSYSRSLFDTLTPLPRELAGMRAVSVKENLYIAGGSGPLGGVDSSLLKYSPGVSFLNGSWQYMKHMNYARANHGVVELNGKIYVFGGDPLNPLLSEEYDPSTNSWVPKSPTIIGSSVFGYTVLDGGIYVAGGSGAPTSLQLYNPNTNTWTLKTDLPVNLVELGLAAGSDGNLYAFGGLRPDLSVNSKIYKYSPALNQWDSLVVPMPTPRFSFGCVSFRGKIYLIGGFKELSLDPPLNSIEVFDPFTQTWSYTDNLPQGVIRFAATVYGPGIIIAGGMDQSNAPRSRVDFLIPNPIFAEIGKKIKGKVGETIHVPIYINGDLSADSIFSIEVGVTFSHTLFSGSNSVTIGALGSQFDSVASSFRTGTVRDTLYLAMANGITITGSGKQLLADMNLQVTSGSSGTVDSIFIFRSIFNEGKPLLFRLPGTIRIQPVFGDVTKDYYGNINATDASLVLQSRVHIVSLDTIQLQRADVSGMQGITAFDASLILQYTVGLITSFPAESGYTPAKFAPVGPQLFVRTDMERGIPEKEIADIIIAGKGIQQGQIVAVPVSIENINPLYSLEMEFAYPNGQYEFLGARLGEPLKGFYMERNCVDGHVILAIANSKPATAGGKMVELYFRQLGNEGDAIDLISMLVNEEDVTKYLPKVGKPDKFALLQNYPNPFNPTTQIRYQLPEAVQVLLVIYNILGQEIRMLVDTKQNAGFYSMLWDGKNNAGLTVASGVYLYRLKAGSFVETKKMLFLK